MLSETRTFGIELEVIFPRNASFESVALWRIWNGRLKYWNRGHQGGGSIKRF